MKIFFSIYPLLILLLFPITSFGFNLTVTAVNETCAGNGSLSFSVSNTTPGSSIVYVVYKLPDVTTPYASGTDTTLNGLTAGNYRVIARETLGSTTTTQQQDVTITSSFIPLTYTVTALNQACSTTSTISISVNTGTAATYEIISGPATFPSQTANTFSGLAAGIYRIRVTDTCGNAIVQAFTVTLNPTLLTVNNPSFTDTSPPSCDFVVANNTISSAPGTVIGYPLQISYVLNLPNGTIQNINTILNSGDPTSINISQTVPYTNSQDYIYTITITDACGTTYPGSSFFVNKELSLASSIVTLECNQYYFTMLAANYIGSYTMQFTSAPAGFNPSNFNPSYPGPFMQSNIQFGNDTNTVPIGDYTVTITDFCGRTKSADFSILDQPPIPIITGVNNGCLSDDGKIVLSLANYEIITAVITVAPPDYPFPLPHDVSSLIGSDASLLIIDPVPLGFYTIVITDNCGNIIPPIDVVVPAFEDQGNDIEILQGCDLNTASIKIATKDSRPVSIKITAAPSAYLFAIPHDVSNHIVSNGHIYVSNLTTGNYTFTIVDTCGIITVEQVVIDGYIITRSNFSLVPDCGAFNIPLDVINNVSSDEFFGLQKLVDATTNTWGNPDTNAIYIDGTVPNATNSYPLQNDEVNLNFTFNGTFRIVHHFTSFNNGSDINSNIVASEIKDCIEILSPTLNFDNALAINDVYLIPCSSSGNFDVFIDATGIPPLNYSIVEKDGSPFVVDNGTSNIFLNLAPGIYKFEVEDSCSNSINRTFDVTDLTSLVIIYPICDIFSCVSTLTGNETFDFTSQTATILGVQSPTEYTLSYHTSQAEADNNQNPITNLTAYNPSANPQTIFIRLLFNQFPNCYQTASFDLITGQTPQINLAPEYVECNSQPINLDASNGNLPTTTYSWSNGLTTPTITISDTGTTLINITATNIYSSCNSNPFTCTTSKDITVNIADIPEIDFIDTQDWTDNQNSITVITTQNGAYEYSMDGITFQDSNVFSNLLPGLYTVFVRDKGRCRTVTEVVWLLHYPKFFTPNGDGYNETWYVKNSENEPDFNVYIFDRYGKLITNILPNSPGWDGKLNGRLLFADDYWFEAHRQDGRILKGHFTLKR
jgi:gliding motility-associated-like protein